MATFSYKNIQYAPEATYGVSVAIGTVSLPVKSFNLNRNPEATIVEQTTNTAKGFRRAINVKDTVEGDAAFNADFINVGYWLKLGLAGGVTSVAIGTSASTYTFLQNTSGTPNSARFDVDKGVAIEATNGVFATKLDLTASDGIVEGTISLIGSRQFAGATFVPTVVESRVATFANAKWYIGLNASLGVAGATIEVPVTDWSLSYNSGFEAAFESGNKFINRVNGKMPSLEVSLSRFFDNAVGSTVSYVLRDLVYSEDVEKPMKLVLTSASDDTITGTTPYVLTFPIPKAKLMMSDRPYEAGAFVVEKIDIQGLVDDTAGYMCEPSLTTKIGLTF